MKTKITLKEFFKMDKACIHCDTVEKSRELLKAFDKMSERWCNYESYLGDNKWSLHRAKTCYEKDGTYCSKNFYENDDGTYKPICDDLRAMGYEIIREQK